jgi:hypothetical protein
MIKKLVLPIFSLIFLLAYLAVTIYLYSRVELRSLLHGFMLVITAATLLAIALLMSSIVRTIHKGRIKESDLEEFISCSHFELIPHSIAELQDRSLYKSVDYWVCIPSEDMKTVGFTQTKSELSSRYDFYIAEEYNQYLFVSDTLEDKFLLYQKK